MEKQFARTGDGVAIAYRLDGGVDAPVLMLSNSIATSLEMWDEIVPALSRSHRVLRYDTRGHGRSGVTMGAYSLDRLGRDALELLDALGIGRVDVCGLSLGGMVGQWLGIHAPDRIGRLVLANTAPSLAPAQQWDALIAQLRSRTDMESMADMFIGNWFLADYSEWRPEVVAAFRRMITRTSPDGLAGCFAAVRDMDFRRTNTLIAAPTLVIGGTSDTVTLPAHSEQIVATIPNARLVMLDGVHLLNVEIADDFVQHVAGFLSGDHAA